MNTCAPFRASAKVRAGVVAAWRRLWSLRSDADAGGAGAVDDHPEVAEAAVREAGVVHQPRERDHGRAPLIVVENRDVEHGVEAVFDLEAGGRGDVLQVDAAVHGCERGNAVDHALRVGGAGILAAFAAMGERHGPAIHVAERFEEHSLSFHHGHACQRAQVTQAEDGRAVGDHGDEIRAGGDLEGTRGVRGEFLHGHGHAGRVGQAEIARGLDWTGQREPHLAAEMELEHFFAGDGGLGHGHFRSSLRGVENRTLVCRTRAANASRTACVAWNNPFAPRGGAPTNDWRLRAVGAPPRGAIFPQLRKPYCAARLAANDRSTVLPCTKALAVL